MLLHCQKDEVFTFSVMPPLYIPFYNQWSKNEYYAYDPFDLDPFSLRASSTSGSPVLLAEGKFFGFMNECGGSFAYDGACTLTVRCPAGQVLYYNEDCYPLAEWRRYNEAVLSDPTLPKPFKNAPFHGSVEYCTWVDQKRYARVHGMKSVWDPLTEGFLYDYMKRVEKLGLPRGKLTIDDGWDIRYAEDGKLSYGNWQIDRQKFPHMERLVRDMTEEGFIPGLWFSPFAVTPNSLPAARYPHLMGGPYSGNAETESWRNLTFLIPDGSLEEYYREIFTPYVEMGFKKFKLDMGYGGKRDMKALLSIIYRVIKQLDPTVEVESHIPDIFVSRHCDTVRMNDTNFDTPDWRAITKEHHRVCLYSAHDRILNLDHLGTNSEDCTEENFMAHSRLLMQLDGGYPCVSLLPDYFSRAAADEFTGMIRAWAEEHSR